MKIPLKTMKIPFLKTVKKNRNVYLLLVVCLLIVFSKQYANTVVEFFRYHLDLYPGGKLVLLPDEIAASRQAYCLDGSPPGYYIRHGGESKKWFIYLSGGRFCKSLEECYSRSSTELGSSKDLPYYLNFEGLQTKFPDFYNWNMVSFIYCDGASYLGNRNVSISYKSKNIYMRGFAVFHALVDHLIEHTDISSAENVLLAGTSVGGLGALINSECLRESVPSVRFVHVLLDGMEFTDGEPDEDPELDNILKRMYDFHNIKETMKQKACTSTLKSSEQWKCIQPDYYYKNSCLLYTTLSKQIVFIPCHKSQVLTAS